MQCREGEEGDNLYVIQSGVFEAVKGSGDDEKLLFKYEGAGAFGELALMYNCRRAATVRVRFGHASCRKAHNTMQVFHLIPPSDAGLDSSGS